MTKKIGIVHARGIMGAVIGIIPAKLTGAKFIFDMKSSLAEAYRLNGRIKRGSFTYKAITFLERKVVLNSDEVIVETKAHKEELEKLFASGMRVPSISILPCCVDVERFIEKKDHAYIPEDGKTRIVYLGSLSGWYMLSEMLDLFKTLKKMRPDSEFFFLSDDKEGLIAGMAREKGVEGVIIKKVRYEDVPNNLWGMTAGILFKLPNERLDSFPIKIAEYLAAGLPIIINSGMGDVEDMVVKNRVGVLVDSCNEESYVKAVTDLDILLKEGIELQKRCEGLAARELSSSHGLSVYRRIYQSLA